MKLEIKPEKPEWWFWAVTLVFIILALAGWEDAYDIVLMISAVQVIYIALKTKSLFAFENQIRLVYFAYTLFALWEAARFWFFLALLMGTFMVTFFDKCSIAMVLQKLPWNRKQ